MSQRDVIDKRHPHQVPPLEQERLGWGGWWTKPLKVDADTLQRADDALLRLKDAPR